MLERPHGELPKDRRGGLAPRYCLTIITVRAVKTSNSRVNFTAVVLCRRPEAVVGARSRFTLGGVPHLVHKITLYLSLATELDFPPGGRTA